jgi:hypothetical protein
MPVSRASVLSATIVGLAFGFSAGVSVGFSSVAKADGVKDYRIYQEYQSVRAMGMGNAYTAVADDYATLFYNPAGLARLEEGQLNLSLGGYLDTKFPKFYNDVKDAASTGTDSEKATNISNVLSNNFGNYYNARLSLLQAVWVRPGWGIAVLPIDLNMDMSVHQDGVASLNLIAHQDTTVAFGRGWDVHWLGPDHQLSMGVTGKAVYRGYFNKALTAADLSQNSNFLSADDADEGMTVDADYGLLWSPKIAKHSWWRVAKPTVGFVVRNIADYGFKTNFHLIGKNTGVPDKLGRRFDVGAKFDLPEFWVFKPRVSADVRDMADENFTFLKGTHLGAEFLWKIRSWWQGGWRIGLNQGYFTAGFTGTLGIFTLDLVTYADEVGTSDRPKAVRNYGLRASLDF